jgi:hypothetical protein
MDTAPNVSSFPLYRCNLDGLTVSNDLPIAPYSMGTHESPPDGYGDQNYDDGPTDPRMTRLQIFLQRSVAGWPLYTIIISFGQVRVTFARHSIHSLLYSCLVL